MGSLKLINNNNYIRHIIVWTNPFTHLTKSALKTLSRYATILTGTTKTVSGSPFATLYIVRTSISLEVIHMENKSKGTNDVRTSCRDCWNYCNCYQHYCNCYQYRTIRQEQEKLTSKKQPHAPKC